MSDQEVVDKIIAAAHELRKLTKSAIASGLVVQYGAGAKLGGLGVSEWLCGHGSDSDIPLHAIRVLSEPKGIKQPGAIGYE